MTKMRPSKELLEWAEDYKDHLSILKRDLELYIDKDSKIFISLDFKDIFDYSFPDLHIFRKKSFKALEDSRNDFLRKALTRYWLLEFKSFYTENGIVILPPYMAEAFDLFKMFNNRLMEFIKRNEKDKENFIKFLKKGLEDIDFSSDSDMNLFLERLESTASYLAFLLTPSFDEDINTLKDLLKNKLLTKQLMISEYEKIIFRSFLRDFPRTRQILDAIRPMRIMQNYKDARAIQYIEDINNEIENNQLFLLVSSSKLFIDYFAYLRENNISSYQKTINGRKYPPIRRLVTFEVALLELCDYIGEKYVNEPTFDNIPNFEFKEIDYKRMLAKVKIDLDVLSKYIEARKGEIDTIDGGKIKEIIEDDINLKFMKFEKNIDRRQKTDLILMMKKMCQNDDALFRLEKYLGKGNQLISALIDMGKWGEEVEPHNLLKHKINAIRAERRDIERNLDRNYRNISKEDINYEIEIYNFGKMIRDILEDGSLIELMNELNFNNLEYPEDPELIKCGNGLWILQGKNDESNIYYLENRDSNYIYYRWNLISIRRILNQIKSGLENGILDPSDLSTATIMTKLENKIIALKGNIKNQYMDHVEKDYKELKEKADLIAKYRESSGIL